MYKFNLNYHINRLGIKFREYSSMFRFRDDLKIDTPGIVWVRFVKIQNNSESGLTLIT